MAHPLKKKEEIKVFILYVLDKIGYPLAYNTIAAMMLQDGAIEFFDFGECFFELVDAGLIIEVDPLSVVGLADYPDVLPDPDDEKPQPLYEVSEKGKRVADGLSDGVMRGIRERGYRSAVRHLSFHKSGATVDHSWEKEGDNYLFKCSINDRHGTVMDVSVRVDSPDRLERMRTNYVQHPEIVYRGLVALLTGDVNYIIDE